MHVPGHGVGLTSMRAATYSARAAAASFGRLTAGFQDAECPAEVIEQTPELRRARSFEQCLRDHGRDLDSGYPDQCAPSCHCSKYMCENLGSIIAKGSITSHRACSTP